MERLDIAKGMIYHYFKSNEDLFEAVIEDIVTESLAQMERLIPTLKGTALEKIQALFLKGSQLLKKM